MLYMVLHGAMDRGKHLENICFPLREKSENFVIGLVKSGLSQGVLYVRAIPVF